MMPRDTDIKRVEAYEAGRTDGAAGKQSPNWWFKIMGAAITDREVSDYWEGFHKGAAERGKLADIKASTRRR